MENLETFDEIDKQFDNSMEDNEISGDIFNEEIEEDEETLESLMQDATKSGTEEDKSFNPENSIDKSSEKQQSNKSKGNNNSQDLVDADGNVIAKAGAERRFYEENQKLKRERDHFNSTIMPQIKQEYDTMVAKINAYNETFKSMQMGDLSTEDIHLGMELIRQWKKSPEETINFL